eukprot:scaffold2293_cov81-Skeletonema_dohrnii-CCMP3373.AAC.10
MNTSATATNTCPLAEETRAEIVSSPVGTKFNSISSLDVEEADASVVDASPKAKTMKEVLLSCGRGLAVSVVIVVLALALAGKGGFIARTRNHNDPPGTDVDIADDMMMNVNKQVSVVSGEGKNAVHYDFTMAKFGGGIPSDRTLQVDYTFTKFGNGVCKDVNNQSYDEIGWHV